MERKQIANVVIPAVAVAALIALVAVVIVAGGPEEPKKKAGDSTTAAPVAAADPSAAGMSDTMPPVSAPEWKDIGGGLEIWDVKVGEGPEAKAGASVTIHYTGWLTAGTVFDSSVQRGKPAQFPLPNLIPAWQQGIPGMKPGGIRRLHVPPNLGYGPRGQPPKIPSNATLIFEVKFISSP